MKSFLTLSVMLIGLVLCLFPNGRFTPRQMMWLALAWRSVTELSIPNVPDNERMAMEQAGDSIKELSLSQKHVENLKAAVAEATMNAMEH